MSFTSFEVEEANGMILMDDKGFKDSSSDEFSSVGSMDSGEEDVNSSLSSSPISPFSYSKSPPYGQRAAAGVDALNDMSSLLQQLPLKRGLSKYYEGKSKSFTCLSNVRSLEDLAKPENPYNKKLKSCKSYVGLYRETQVSSNIHKTASSKSISKKTSRNTTNNRPPSHPLSRSNSSTHFSTQNPSQIRTPLFV